jgi:hypothetical protein
LVVVGRAGALVIVSALGIGLAGPSGVDVFSALCVSLAEIVFSFALVEVCLFVTVVSLVLTVVSSLFEDASLDVSELGGRLGLGFFGFTVVVF